VSTLASLPSPDGFCQRPDVAWIKKHVPVLSVANALGLEIQQRRARCWRIENHANGDADPSLRFHQLKNRVRCFVCDMHGGHSNIDLVMGVLGISFTDAVSWIAQRFAVPNTKVGRPIGSCATGLAPPYRFGANGSHFEVLVRSGMFGCLSAAERSILVALWEFRDTESGITTLSYSGIMRYAGIGSRANVAKAVTHLKRLHAVQVTQGSRIGVIRQCNSYVVTLDDAKFLDACNRVFTATRNEVERERDYRREARATRERATRSKDAQSRDTCTSLNLSSLSELSSNKAVLCKNREIENLACALWMIREREKINRQEPDEENAGRRKGAA
jgi:hypothetical protein